MAKLIAAPEIDVSGMTDEQLKKLRSDLTGNLKLVEKALSIVVRNCNNCGRAACFYYGLDKPACAKWKKKKGE